MKKVRLKRNLKWFYHYFIIYQTLYDAGRKKIYVFAYYISFRAILHEAEKIQDDSSILYYYIIFIWVPYWIRLCKNLLTAESGMCRPHPIATQSSVYIWNIPTMYTDGIVTYWTYAFLWRGLFSCKRAWRMTSAGPRAVVTRFALFIIDTELYTRHKQSPWTIQYHFACPRIEILRAAMSCLPIPPAWNSSLVNTRRSRRRSRRSGVDSPLPTCRRATVFKQRRVNYTPWFYFSPKHQSGEEKWDAVGRVT